MYIFAVLFITVCLSKKGREVDKRNNGGSTYLCDAARNGHTEIVRELLKLRANVNLATNNGFTPLNAASYSGYLDVVKELLSENIDVNKPEKGGGTPL